MYKDYFKKVSYWIVVSIVLIILAIAAFSNSSGKKKSPSAATGYSESTRLIANCKKGIKIEKIKVHEKLGSPPNYIIQRDKNKKPIQFISLTTKSKKKVTVAPLYKNLLYRHGRSFGS